MTSRILWHLIALLLALLSLWASSWVFEAGFDRLSHARQLDRMPQSPIAALRSGIYRVQGVAEPQAPLVTAPYSSESVIYVRYLLEEEYRDSEGKTRTRTLDSGVRHAAFQLRDESGMVHVQPDAQRNSLQWHLDNTYHSRRGNRIYREWTLKPGNSVHVLGFYNSHRQSLGFDQADAMPMLVSRQPLQARGGEHLLRAATWVSLASGLLSLGLAFLLIGFGVNRFWMLVTTLSIGLVGFLWAAGMTHLQRDWQRTSDYYMARYLALPADTGADSALLLDLHSYRAAIALSSQQWPDRWLFERRQDTLFPVPSPIGEGAQAELQQRLTSLTPSRFDDPVIFWLLFVCSLLIMLVLFVVGIKAIRLKRLIEHIPTAKAAGLSYGLTELTGVLQSQPDATLFKTPLRGAQCLAYHYKVTEQRNSGKRTTVVTLEERKEVQPCLLRDDSGVTTVYPEQATLCYAQSYSRRQGARTYTERWLPPETQVYVLGFAGVDPAQSSRLAIQYDRDNPYIITVKDQQTVIRQKGAAGFLATAASLGFALLAGTLVFAYRGQFTPGDLFGLALLIPAFLIFYTAVLHYNDLIFLRARVDRAFANIQTLLKRRFELWPNLAALARQYMQHESQLLQAIAQLRQQNRRELALTARLAQEHQVMDSVIARMEAYPELKANQNMAQIMSVMTDTENQLALVRNGYLDAVEIYNTRVQSFPDVMLAKLLRLSPVRNRMLISE